ncbi:hypothetical protein AMD01_02840 [Priestia koreensis]|uniref:Uncharacterized protein n=1 Tax=Priestia koreensis TaxID=284581 RepID=A0A0M0LI91_9BACI|nr:hypothetical protein AMD01_02840 [Priestia koreensis]
MMIIVLLVLFLCIISSISFWRLKKRWISLLLFSPVFIVMSFVGFVFFNSWYHVSPKDVSFEIQQQNQTYTVKGHWSKPLDFYRFPTDFIAIDTGKQGVPITMKRPRIHNHKSLHRSFLDSEVRHWLNEQKINTPSLTLFDVRASRSMQFSFTLPQGIDPSSLKIYYIHVREDPMDPLTFWKKRIVLP